MAKYMASLFRAFLPAAAGTSSKVADAPSEEYAAPTRRHHVSTLSQLAEAIEGEDYMPDDYLPIEGEDYTLWSEDEYASAEEDEDVTDCAACGCVMPRGASEGLCRECAVALGPAEHLRRKVH